MCIPPRRSPHRLLALLIVWLCGTLSACATVRVPEAELLDAAEQQAFLDGRDAYLRGEDQAALELLQPALTVAPPHLATHLAHQDVLRSLGRGDELPSLYPVPAAAPPSTWRAILLAGRVLADSDRRLAEYRRAFTSAPDEPWPRIALAYELIGRADAATTAAEAHVDDGSPTLAEEARTRAAVAWGEATTLVNSLRESHPNLPEVALVDAHLLQAGGESDEALRRVRRATELDPAMWRAHALTARLLRSEGRDDEAVRALERVLDLAPRMGGAAALLGRALLDLQRDAEAREVLERTIALRPDDAASRVNLAVALTRLGELDEAERIASEVARERPRDERVAEALGRIRRLKEARDTQ